MFFLLHLFSNTQCLIENPDASMMDLTALGSGSDQIDIQSDDSKKIDAFSSSKLSSSSSTSDAPNTIALDMNRNTNPLVGGWEFVHGLLENWQDYQRNHPEEHNKKPNWCPDPTYPNVMCCDQDSHFFGPDEDGFSYKLCVLSEFIWNLICSTLNLSLN